MCVVTNYNKVAVWVFAAGAAQSRLEAMKRGLYRRAWWLGVGLVVSLAALPGLLHGASVQAQQYTPPPPPLTTLPPCPSGPNDKERAKKLAKEGECDPTNVPQPQPQLPPPTPAQQAFPFPGDGKPAQTPAAQAFPFPGSDSGSGNGSSTGNGSSSPAAGSTPNTPASKQYPYPGSDAAGPMPGADGKPTAPAGSSGSPQPSNQPQDDAPGSSSSSSSSSSSDHANSDSASGDNDTQPKLIDKGSHGRRSHHGQSDSDRVDEDLSVSHFYLQSGNLMGAYLRAQDAVKTQPDYARGHYALGEAAEKLGHRDEAKAEFKQYLKLEPDGEKAKSAEKELKKLK